MTIKWTPEGKVDRYLWGIASPTERKAQRDRVADALDVAVAALRQIGSEYYGPLTQRGLRAKDALRQLGIGEMTDAELRDLRTIIG